MFLASYFRRDWESWSSVIMSCKTEVGLKSFHVLAKLRTIKTREGFLRKNIVAVSFFQNCAIHQYS